MADPEFRAVSASVTIPSQGNGSVSVDKPTGTVDGDYVILACFTGSDGNVANVAPSGFTSLQVINNGSFNSGVRVFGKVASSEGASWSITEGSSNSQGTAFAVSYSNPNATPINASAQSGQQTSTAAPAFPAVTTTAVGKLIGIALEYNNRAATITAAGSMTSRIAVSGARSYGCFDEAIATTGSISGRTANSNVTGDFYAVSILLAGLSTTPVLSSPTGAATGNTTANAGATIDAVSGSGSRIMYALPRIGGSAASAATIIATGTQLAITSAGAKSVPLTALTPGASYSADVVYVDATTGESNVVTGTWTQPTAPVLSSPTNTPGSTTALIGATTTVSSGTAYFLARVGGSAASAATIIATGQTSAVSTTTPSRTVTGLTASTANNYVDIVQVSGVTTSNVVSAGPFTTTASGDTTVPVLTGSIVIGTVTSTSIQYSWSAGSDNVGVTSYEVSKDGGSNYTDAGLVLTYTFTGLTASTSYPLRVRAKDAAGNVSTPALAATQSTAAASGVGAFNLNNAALYTFKTNNGTIITNAAVTFYVHDVSTGALIGSAITGLSTDASGLVTTAISNASMLAGTQYRLVIESSTGKYGSIKLTAV